MRCQMTCLLHEIGMGKKDGCAISQKQQFGGSKSDQMGTAFVLKSILSDMGIATHAFFWSLFA